MNAPERDVDERFADWIDGRMSARDRERFEAELRVNAALRARLDDYRTTVEAVRTALRAPLPRIDVADAVIERIASGAAGPSAVQRAPWRHASRRALWLSGSLAAAAALLIGVLLNWSPSPSTSQIASKPAEPAAAANDGLREQEKVPLADGEAAEERDRSTRLSMDHVELKKAAPGAAPPADRSLAGGEKSLPEAQTQLVQDTGALTAASPANEPERRAFKLAVPGATAGAAGPATPAAPTPPAEKPPIVTAQTMLPQVMLQRRDTDAYAVPQGQTAAANQATAFFTQVGSGLDLATALPAATLQFRRLEALPPAATLASMREMLKLRQRADSAAAESRQLQEGQATGEAEAWLIEGPGPEVYSYLARLSDAGKSSGYDVAIGEVPTREIELLLPALPEAGFLASASNERARDEARAKDRDDERIGGRPAAGRLGNPAAGSNKDATNKDGSNKDGTNNDGTSRAGSHKGGIDKSAETSKDGGAAKPKAEAKERSAADDKAPAPTPSAAVPPANVLTVTATPEPSPVPVPDPMPAQARVVVIIERGKAR